MAAFQRPLFKSGERIKGRPQFCLSICGGDLSRPDTEPVLASLLCGLRSGPAHPQQVFSGVSAAFPGPLARKSGFSQNLRFLFLQHWVGASWEEEKMKKENQQDSPKTVNLNRPIFPGPSNRCVFHGILGAYAPGMAAASG